MSLNKKSVLAVFLFMFLITGATKMFGIGKTCVFSQVKVRVTKNGVPLENLPVIRRWEWNSLREDKTTTDKEGYFTFPAVFEESVSRLLPVELVIAQGLYVVVEGKEIKIWSNSKREPEENAEFGKRPVVMDCDLASEMRIHKEFGSMMRTLCTW